MRIFNTSLMLWGTRVGSRGLAVNQLSKDRRRFESFPHSQIMKHRICEDCQKDFSHRPKERGKVCGSCRVQRSRRRTKQRALEYKGGKCQKCGYSKCQRALTFHHLDPTAKEFGIADPKNRSFEAIKDELDKCMLLCMNCHMEEHEN